MIGIRGRVRRLLDKIPMGSAINRGLTFRMAQTPVQRYLPMLFDRIEKGEIDPSFVVTHRAAPFFDYLGARLGIPGPDIPNLETLVSPAPS